MKILVRDAVAADIPFLENQADRIVKTPYTWSRHVSDSTESLCLIAELDGQPVGENSNLI